MKIIVHNLACFQTNLIFLNSITKSIILTGVHLLSLKTDIRLERLFVPISLLKQIYWYISLHVINNTLLVFNIHCTKKAKIVLLIYSWLEYRRRSIRMNLNNIAVRLLFVSYAFNSIQ
jgi:hypothetical protein